MRSRRSGFGGWLSIGVVALALGLGAPARALTLADLDAGDDLTSLDGTLTFSDFSIAISGDLNPDLGLYTVERLDAGFRINGAIAVADEAAGSLDLTYTVTAAGPLEIAGARIFFNAAVWGESASAVTMEELLSDGGGSMVGQLDLLVDGSGANTKVDEASFSELASLLVQKSISVDSEGAVAVTLSVIDQTFTVVPEPATAGLLVAGLAGLAACAPRRRRSR
jgi:hypothetical protein